MSAFEACVDDSHRLLIKAADTWAEGNPEEPATEQVLNAILEKFEAAHFLRRPYGCQSGGESAPR